MKSRLLGEYWHECARSGFTYPESQMTEVKSGVWIATRFLDPEDMEDDNDRSN